MIPRCGSCLRDCRPGTSFCGRKDAEGRPVARHTYHALLADSLFDKPILHFADNFRVLSVGSWGCNLRCLGCQNARLSWTTDGEGLPAREMKPEALVRLAQALSCRGICFTFNEPAVMMETAADAARAARRAGLASILVTNSTLAPAAAEQAGPVFDAVAADIKSLSNGFYDDYCGTHGLSCVAEGILECVLAFRRSGCHLEVRTNIIPGANDQDENLKEIAGWIRDSLGPDTPWHVTRFFPAHRLRHLEPTPPETLLRAERIGRASGLRRVHAFLDKGCDCAPEGSFIESKDLPREAPDHACCSRSAKAAD